MAAAQATESDLAPQSSLGISKHDPTNSELGQQTWTLSLGLDLPCRSEGATIRYATHRSDV